MRHIVLIAALSQLVGLYFFGAGNFETGSRFLPTFIQPAGWAFSIWGMIYTLSLVYAVYQWLPRNDNQALRANRPLATVAFLGSSAWLFFANQGGVLLWLTIPTLFIMAGVLNFIVTQKDITVPRFNFYSKAILYPYAAWTGIAQWLNVQALLNQERIITDPVVNISSNLAFLILIGIYSFAYFRVSGWSMWYGGVIAWAALGIVSANVMPDGNLIIAFIAGALCLLALAFVRRPTYGVVS
jgi:hypothetical protein